MDFVYALASFLIASVAFGFGAAKLFQKKKPLYWQILVCAAGCFALQQLSRVVNIWCGVTASVSIGMLGIFGCNFFLLSANFGTLDKIVDDGKGSAKARLAALAAPAVMAVLLVAAFLAWQKTDRFCAAAWAVILLPALPASYYNLKHILLPVDPFAFLRATGPCNVIALVFYTLTAVCAIVSASGSTPGGILAVLMSLSMLALSLCAVRGAKQWGI